MTLGERIEKARQERQLSQKELATQLGKKTIDIALWESNEAVPSISDLTKISSILGVSVDSLVNNIDFGEEKSVNDTDIEAGVEDSKTTKIFPSKTSKPKMRLGLIVGIISVIVIGVIIALFAFNSSKPFSENTESIEKAASSVVKIYCYDYEGNESATGSGFIVFDDQTVVTNYHVMAEAYTCRISTDEDKTLAIESIINYSQEKDIAILRLKESSELNPLVIGESDNIKKGETVTAIGSPLGLKNTVSKGILSGRVMEDSMDVLSFTAEISAGSSGGALFNEQGEVIGITYASYENGQDLNLAIPMEKVSELYSIKILERKPSAIYIFEHPYAQYLSDYKDVKEVSINELKTNPEKWNGQTIKVIAYASSVDNEIYNGTVSYITDNKNAISNNKDQDMDIYFSTDFSETNTVYIGGADVDYEEDKLIAGDIVCVIGKFVYYPRGSEEKHELLKEPWIHKYDEGRLSAKIIYKVADRELS